MKVKCGNCKKIIHVEDKRYNSYERLEGKGKHTFFCSNKCQYGYQRTGKICTCAECGKKTYKSKSDIKKSKSGKMFCSKSCSVSYWNRNLKTGPYNPRYKGKSYRKHALRVLGHKCTFCNYDNKKVIQVHHKDQNRNNNKIENLLIVCPTHHWEIHLGVLDLKSITINK